MKTNLFPLNNFCRFTLAGLLVLTLAGCKTTSRDAGYIDSAGPRTIVSLDQINIQDWANAGDQMVNSLLASGVMDRAPEQPAVLAMSRIVNNTTQQVDTDFLTRRIRVALNRSGKAFTTTTFGPGGVVEDELALEAGEYQRFTEGESAPRPLPYFTLSGKLLENRAQAGSTRQVTYVFQLALTEVRSGLAVWEDEVQITKQGERASVGW